MLYLYRLTPNLLVLAGRNGEITESGADSMADLWASYHSALGLGSKPPKAPTPLTTGQSVSFKVEQRFIINLTYINVNIDRLVRSCWYAQNGEVEDIPKPGTGLKNVA